MVGIVVVTDEEVVVWWEIEHQKSCFLTTLSSFCAPCLVFARDILMTTLNLCLCYAVLFYWIELLD